MHNIKKGDRNKKVDIKTTILLTRHVFSKSTEEVVYKLKTVVCCRFGVVLKAGWWKF